MGTGLTGSGFTILVHNDGTGEKIYYCGRILSAGGTRIYIDTSGRPQYAPTRAFYERIGFRCDAVLADFYAPGDDRVIYVKCLAANPKQCGSFNS